MEHVELHAASGWKQRLMPELVQFDQSTAWKAAEADNQISAVQRESHREEEREPGVTERRAGELNDY